MMLILAIALQGASTMPIQDPAKSDKKICRTSVATGSMLAGRLCMTRQKWREADARDRANVDSVRHSLNTKGTDRTF